MTALLVALAGAAGASARYGISAAVGPRPFGWTTLAINIAGSFALGLVLRLALARGWPDSSVLPISVGFLGAFTTFSTFSTETYTLLRDDRAGAALAYVGISVLGGLAAAAAGSGLGRALSS